MSDTDLAISVRGLGKSYTIRHQQRPAHTTLAESIMHRLRHPFDSAGTNGRETFWALQDVSFDVRRGEVVGIIGRNGAGKSTLLKVLSRITEPTTGEIDLWGRVGSLLEVGTGFHQELTGRENIFLNGSILGMTRAEIRQQFDAIVSFAGVEQFLDTPVKRYSSGMYVRLAFAVAAHLRSEILIVDEVLAVGDAEFQKRCLGKMKEVASGGRTVLFVSHNMHAIRALCDRAILIVRGRTSATSDLDSTIAAYEAVEPAAPEITENRRGSGEYRFTLVQPSRPQFECDEEKSFAFRIEHRHGAAGRFFLSAHVIGEDGQLLLQCDSRLVADGLEDALAQEGVLRLRTPWLKPGRYRLDLSIVGGGYIDVLEHACHFSVGGVLPYANVARDDATERGVVLADFQFELATGSPPQRSKAQPDEQQASAVSPNQN